MMQRVAWWSVASLLGLSLLGGCDTGEDAPDLVQSTVQRGADGFCYLIEVFPFQTRVSEVEEEHCTHIREPEGV